MRTVQFIPQVKQLRKARESLDIFVRVAAQLGMDTIEVELEARLCHDETQPARALGFRPPAPRGGRATPRGHPHPVVRGMARRTAHAARPARPGSLRDSHRVRHPAAGVHGTYARLGPPAVRLMARRIPRTEPLPAAGLPRHRAVVALDIERSTSRPDPVKAELRSTLYEVFDVALLEAGIRRQYRDRFIDRGDGILALIHPVDQAPTAALLKTAIPALSQLLTDYNASLPRASRAQRQLRIRAVVHAGEVNYDANGCFGEALNVAFRLLDSAHVKKALQAAADPLILVISGDIYRAIVRHGYDGIDQRAFHPLIRVRIGGYRYPGWIHIPGQAARNQVTEIASYRQPA